MRQEGGNLSLRGRKAPPPLFFCLTAQAVSKAHACVPEIPLGRYVTSFPARYDNGMRARRSRAAFLSMSIPTCDQIGAALERTVRSIAIVAAVFFVAGEACGRSVYQLSDWLVDLTRRPVDTLLGLVPTKPKPEPVPVLQLLGAELLTEERLDEEIKTYEKKRKPRPARRRKPKVTKVAAEV